MIGPNIFFTDRKAAMKGTLVLAIFLTVSLIIRYLIRSSETNSFAHNTLITVDSMDAAQFFNGHDICEFAVAKNYTAITPSMIPWAIDTADVYSESYIINNHKLTIQQPLKRFDLPDSNRRYYYGKAPLKTIRIINDTLPFNFNDVAIDYGQEANNVYQSGAFVMLQNEPIDWCGLANRYRFIQLFDLEKLICYEFFTDYYSCIKDSFKTNIRTAHASNYPIN